MCLGFPAAFHFGRNNKRPCNHCSYRVSCGAAIQIRTGDLILTKDALYLLSYSSISDSFDIIAREWAAVNSFFQILRLFLHDARRRRCGEGRYRSGRRRRRTNLYGFDSACTRDAGDGVPYGFYRQLLCRHAGSARPTASVEVSAPVGACPRPTI